MFGLSKLFNQIRFGFRALLAPKINENKQHIVEKGLRDFYEATCVFFNAVKTCALSEDKQGGAVKEIFFKIDTDLEAWDAKMELVHPQGKESYVRVTLGRGIAPYVRLMVDYYYRLSQEGAGLIAASDVSITANNEFKNLDFSMYKELFERILNLHAEGRVRPPKNPEAHYMSGLIEYASIEYASS